MDAKERDAIEARVKAEVRIMLTEGNIGYLQQLTRPSMLEMLEEELGFLGLYSNKDQETPKLIREILEEHLDVWISDPEVQYRLQSSWSVFGFSTESDILEVEPSIQDFHNHEPFSYSSAYGDGSNSVDDGKDTDHGWNNEIDFAAS